MDDFASTAFFNLIASELQRLGYKAQTNSKFEGKTERITKANLLNSALSELGPAAILTIGKGIRRVSFDPTLGVLIKATSSTDFLGRWQRLEKYLHGRHRVRIVVHSKEAMVLEHYSLNGPSPSEGEDLVVAGLLAALLQEIGVKGLSLNIDGHDVVLNAQVIPHTPTLKATRIWSYQWEQEPTGVENALPPIEPGDTAVERVSSVLESDLGRGWKLAAVAELLSTSSRSLQRRLAKSGVNFQTLLRASRVNGAASLLRENKHQLTEIGYSVGFSDQAHFSREFRLRFNMSPTEYVKLAD